MLQKGIEVIADLNDNSDDYPEYRRGQIDLLITLLGYSDDGYALRNYVVSQIDALKESN